MIRLMKRITKLMIGIMSLLILASCYKDVGPIEPQSNLPTEDISFSKNIQPVFNSSCIACHPSSGNLDLTPENSYNSLVNKESSGYNGILVIPEDPDNSILYKKIDGSGLYGGNMPPGYNLTESQVEMFRQWIAEGAKNN